MRVSVHLRDGSNLTNPRSECLAEGLEILGHQVKRRSRSERAGNADLVVQTGFARSYALMDAIDRGIPFLIMEAPFWRHIDVHTNSSWGYNGLAGGAFRHKAPQDERPKPDLLPLKEHGGTVIIGQKPTDHSIRGSVHVEWILEKCGQYPDAEFRPHPLMVPEGTLEPIEAVLERCKRVITYTSTVGAEALIAGCESRPEHPGSIAYGVTDREAWLHEVSWAQFHHNEIREFGAKHIIGGYDEAYEELRAGRFEVPRERVDSQAICSNYYAALEGRGHG